MMALANHGLHEFASDRNRTIANHHNRAIGCRCGDHQHARRPLCHSLDG